MGIFYQMSLNSLKHTFIVGGPALVLALAAVWVLVSPPLNPSELSGPQIYRDIRVAMEDIKYSHYIDRGVEVRFCESLSDLAFFHDPALSCSLASSHPFPSFFVSCLEYSKISRILSNGIVEKRIVCRDRLDEAVLVLGERAPALPALLLVPRLLLLHDDRLLGLWPSLYPH